MFGLLGSHCGELEAFLAPAQTYTICYTCSILYYLLYCSNIIPWDTLIFLSLSHWIPTMHYCVGMYLPTSETSYHWHYRNNKLKSYLIHMFLLIISYKMGNIIIALNNYGFGSLKRNIWVNLISFFTVIQLATLFSKLK